MASNSQGPQTDCSKSEDLDSWVELHYSSPPSTPMVFSHSSPSPPINHSLDGAEIHINDTGPSLMEKLLMDAQRESRTPSRTPSLGPSRVTSTPGSKASSLAGSPKSPPSPTPSPAPEWASERSKEEIGSDWIWDWSSRPDAQQSFENWPERFRHPGHKGRSVLSVRNSIVMKKTRLFSWTNLPTLLFTHAATFFLGAAAVLIYVKKYCNIPATIIAISPVD